MQHKYSFYVVDTETTGLNFDSNVIEISIARLSDDVIKTWCLRTLNDNIDSDALRINKHKLEDITHKTKEGIDRYKDPKNVLVEIENFLMEDDNKTANRVMIGQNIAFDRYMLEYLWKRCESFDSYPFGRRFIDTMQIELFLDMCKNDYAESYSLSALTKKYGVKNEAAHSAEADTKATKTVFEKQVEFFKKKLGL